MRGNDTYFAFDVIETNGLVDGSIEDARGAIEAWQAEWAAMDPNDTFKEMHAERDHDIDFELLVIDLHERGELPVGSYLMKIWW